MNHTPKGRIEKIRERAGKVYINCIGYPGCDGMLPGEAHESNCPYFGSYGLPEYPHFTQEEVKYLLDINAELLAALEKLLAALKNYGKHREGCAVNRARMGDGIVPDPGPCDCGFRAAIKATERSE